MNKSVVQILPSISYGDAVSNHALNIDRYLKDRGMDSIVASLSIDDRNVGNCVRMKDLSISEESTLIYHMAIGSELTEYFLQYSGRKILLYHNITPSRYYSIFDDRFSRILEAGREELKSLAGSADCVMTVSAYNQTELQEYGFSNIHYVPLQIDQIQKVSNSPCSSASNKRLLFVGRVAPHKKQEDLVRMMSYYRQLEPNAVLYLVGGYGEEELYYQSLKKLIELYDLQENIVLTGKVSDHDLHEHYLQADAFISMSEHEGFGIPLMEAIFYQKPVFAYASSSVSDTVGRGGVLFHSKEDLSLLACCIQVTLQDAAFLDDMRSKQEKRIQEFGEKSFESYLDDVLPHIMGTA